MVSNGTIKNSLRDNRNIYDNWKAANHDNNSLILLYLAIKKQYEPYLLLPISFGMLLANLPAVANEGLMEKGGLLYYLYQGVKLGNLSAINIFGDRSKY